MTAPDLLPLAAPLAYLDPGSGSMLLQMLLAGLAGVIVFLKFQGRRLMSLFSGRSKSATPDDSGPSEPGSEA